MNLVTAFLPSICAYVKANPNTTSPPAKVSTIPEEDMSAEEHLESIKSLTLEAIKEEIVESIEAGNDNQDAGDSISVSDCTNRWLY